MRELKRFEKQENSKKMRTKIPFILKNRVEVFFHEQIRYKKGITLVDAYIHCVALSIDCYATDRALFNKLLSDNLFNRDLISDNAMITMPEYISVALDEFKKVFSQSNKYEAFITCVGIGISLFELQKK